jgi:hypothetical protein
VGGWCTGVGLGVVPRVHFPELWVYCEAFLPFPAAVDADGLCGRGGVGD